MNNSELLLNEQIYETALKNIFHANSRGTTEYWEQGHGYVITELRLLYCKTELKRDLRLKCIKNVFTFDFIKKLLVSHNNLLFTMANHYTSVYI